MASSRDSWLRPALGLVLAIAALLGAPGVARGHPMGNFAISHYAGLRIERDAVHLRYLIDLAEIPTFQAMQEGGFTVEPGPASATGRLAPYLGRVAEAWREGLRLELDGRRLELVDESREALVTPGAGGLPTLRVAIGYRAGLPASPTTPLELRYRDDNYPDRAGWKEVVATAGPGVRLEESSVPERDRSSELADYPTDLLSSPPQVLSARVIFAVVGETVIARGGPVEPPGPRTEARGGGPSVAAAAPVAASHPAAAPSAGSASAASSAAVSLERSPMAGTPAPGEIRPGPTPGAPPLVANRRGTPRDAFTQLITVPRLSLGVVALALVVAAGLGAFHALEPGHGKTVVAAYLVGARGTARHAVVLGLVVTASHTVGVYLLGGVTLYASRYVVPERLYPWLGAISGLTIAALGLGLFVERLARAIRARDPHRGAHDHPTAHGHEAHSHGDHAHDHDHGHGGHHHDHHHHHHHVPDGPVSLRALFALGVTGGIVPCPAALVVLLSAVALRRVGLGLGLIVAFSAGLAAALIGIGLLVVYARRFTARLEGHGPLVTRWLPLTSAVVIALSGVVIAVQALASAGLVAIRL
jgi:ABC-type nickel/cobalt efflux system permease component RcnA